MTFNEYTERALLTAAPKTKKNELYHLTMGLVGEAGEVAEKIKKIIRDHDSDESNINTADIEKELGDVLWYIAVLGDYLGLEFEEIASKNLAKLADRQKRNKLGGSGDNR